jgi:hypothetical protein
MRIALTLALALATAACTTPADTADAPTFGASVAAAHRAQIIPADSVDGEPEGSGATGALAQQRYKNGQTRELLPTNTSLTTAHDD